MIVWNKRAGGVLALALVVLAACYCWVLWDTRSVMDDVEAVAYGESNIREEVPEKLRYFVPTRDEDGSSEEIVQLVRYFTSVSGDEGTIWMYVEWARVYSDGTKANISDHVSLSIKDTNGQWEVVGRQRPL